MFETMCLVNDYRPISRIRLISLGWPSRTFKKFPLILAAFPSVNPGGIKGETLNDGFSIQDGDNRFTYVNDKFCKMVGYTSKELVGQPVQMLFRRKKN